jgi:hypothetical protein
MGLKVKAIQSQLPQQLGTRKGSHILLKIKYWDNPCPNCFVANCKLSGKFLDLIRICIYSYVVDPHVMACNKEHSYVGHNTSSDSFPLCRIS